MTEAGRRTVHDTRRERAALAGLASRRGARKQGAARVDPGPLRAVRPRVGQGDRSARQVDPGSFLARRRADRRASRTRSTRSKPGASPNCTSTTTRCARCATPRCCTISAKSPSPSTSSARRRNCPTASSTRSGCAFCSRSSRSRTLGARRKFELLQTGVAFDDRRDPRHRRRHGVARRRTAGAARQRSSRPTNRASSPPRSARMLDSIIGKTYLDLDDEKPLLDTGEFEFLRIPRGSLSNDERQQDGTARHAVVLFPARDPVEQDAVAQRARPRLRAPRASRRHRLSARPQGRGDRAASAHADDRRRLRCAHRQGSALQSRRCRSTARSTSWSKSSRSAARSTPNSSTSSSRAKSTRRSIPPQKPPRDDADHMTWLTR